MKHGTCPVDGCGKPIKRGGYCYGHYMKNWRYGTPTPDHGIKWEDLTGRRYGTLVVVERVGYQWRCECDCGRSRLARAGDLNRYGDANTCGDGPTHHRRANAGYVAAHSRVRRDKGKIKTQLCVDCQAPAAHWSYNHTDPDERLAYGLSENPIAYSLNPEHYSPRCIPCHKRFDLNQINATALAS